MDEQNMDTPRFDCSSPTPADYTLGAQPQEDCPTFSLASSSPSHYPTVLKMALLTRGWVWVDNESRVDATVINIRGDLRERLLEVNHQLAMLDVFITNSSFRKQLGFGVTTLNLSDQNGRKLTWAKTLETKYLLQVLLLYGPEFGKRIMWNATYFGALPRESNSLEEVARGIMNGSKRKINSQGETSEQRNLEFPNKRCNNSAEQSSDLTKLKNEINKCAKAIELGDNRMAYTLLNQIKLYTSPTGTAAERLAHYLANSLESRLAGTTDFTHQKQFSQDNKRLFKLYSKACPIQQASHFLSNKTIIDHIEGASKVHIIDFGIGFGFQWPQLIKHLSNKSLKKLRITGIDVAQPGLYRGENIKQTGEFLREYATEFNVPFEFNGIESNWEDVTIESLNIDSDELVIVNCLSHSGYISTNTLAMCGPSDRVLKTIRQLNPSAFIHGVTNSESDTPSFSSHIEEVFLHYHALFDMVDTNACVDNDYRLALEREIFGREIRNAVAFWIPENMGPETFKQWEARCNLAGFMQHAVSSENITNANEFARSYKEDFVIEQENGSVLLGWKGRKVFTLSVWKPS